MKVWIDQESVHGRRALRRIRPGPVGMDAREALVALWAR